jgi:hypothetical protein
MMNGDLSYFASLLVTWVVLRFTVEDQFRLDTPPPHIPPKDPASDGTG